MWSTTQGYPGSFLCERMECNGGFPAVKGLFADHCNYLVDPFTMEVTTGTMKYGDFCHVACDNGYEFVPERRDAMYNIQHVKDFDLDNSPGIMDPSLQGEYCLNSEAGIVSGRCPTTGRCAWCGQSTSKFALGWCCKKFSEENGLQLARVEKSAQNINSYT